MQKLLILFLIFFPGGLVAGGIQGVWKMEPTKEGYYFYLTIDTCSEDNAPHYNELICGRIIGDKSNHPILDHTDNHLIIINMKAGTFNFNNQWVGGDIADVFNNQEFHGKIWNPLNEKNYSARLRLLKDDSLLTELFGWGYYFNKKKWNRISPLYNSP